MTERADTALPDPEEVNEVAAGLLGAIAVEAASNAADQSKNVEDLRATVLGQTPTGGSAPTPEEQAAAWLDLQALGRGAEIPSLDNAAKALVGITVAITGLFTGIGFVNGDFVRMARDFPAQGLTFLIGAGLALLLGTFAFVINAYRSNKNLWAERIAVYFGIFCSAVALIFAAWGLSQGASAGSTRPTIAAHFDSSTNPPSLSVEVKSADVPRSEGLTTTIWGSTAGTWSVLRHADTGPGHDGSIDDSIPVSDISGYDQVAIESYLASSNTAIPLAPPAECTLPTTATSGIVTRGSAELTNGSPPGSSDTPPPSCEVLKGLPTSTTTSTTAP